MFKQAGRHFNASTVIAVFALVFAMSGGAYAASKYLITSTKQISPKVLKQLKGKNGKAGKAGASGVAGPVGPTGAAGKNGANGKDGVNGVSPVGAAFSGNANGCTEGGVKFEGANTGVACNGVKGTDGKSVTVTTINSGGSKCGGRAGAEVKQEGAPSATEVCEGSPWTAGGTLPSGKTETGTWSMAMSSTKFITVYASISFPIRLAAGGENAFAFTQAQTEHKEFGTSGCTGSADEPTAPVGTLCVYTGFELSKNALVSYAVRSPGNGYGEFGPAGAILGEPFLEGTAATPAQVEAFGSWAVTAP